MGRRQIGSRLLSAALVLAGLVLPPTGIGALSSGDAAKGKMVFEQKGGCVNCHGAGGRGDGPAGKMLVPPPADLTSPKAKAKSDAELLKTIQEGRPGTAMIGFKGQLTEQEIRDLLSYVRGLTK
jgi:mono/diheme cytochrome c family protein